MSAPRTLPDPRSGEAGFTLIEMLIATMLMVFILTALATVTAQWLPNWNHGMARMERDERFAFALNRVVEDLAVAEFVPANATAKIAIFRRQRVERQLRAHGDRAELAAGAGNRPLPGGRRRQAARPWSARAQPFVPMDANAQVRFADPVVLIRSPYRVTFAYAGADDTWQPTWRNAAELPQAHPHHRARRRHAAKARGVDGGAGAYRHARRMRAREKRHPVPDADRARHGGSRQSSAGRRGDRAALIRSRS